MNITRIEVEGLKSTGRESIELSPLTLVVGPNGAGKSLVKDAIDFALTSECAGVSAAGSELRDAVGGDAMSVTMYVDTPEGPINVQKRRDFNRKTGAFGKPKTTIGTTHGPVGGDDSDQIIAQWMGDPSAPRNLLDISADKMTAALAAIGAKVVDPSEILDDVSAILKSFTHHSEAWAGSMPTPRLPDGDAGVVLAKLRESARSELAAARDAKKKIEGSTDRSRSATADDTARPDDVPRTEAAVTAAAAQLADAKTRHGAAQTALTAMLTPDPAQTARVSDLLDRRTTADIRVRSANVAVEALRASLALAEADATEYLDTSSPVPDIAALTAQALAAAAYHSECVDELSAAALARVVAVAAAESANAAASDASDHLAMTERGECPTCGQNVGAEVVNRAAIAHGSAFSAAGAAVAAAKAASAYVDQVRDDVTAARTESDRLTSALGLARLARDTRESTQRTIADTRARLATAEAQKTNADAALREVEADLESARAQVPTPNAAAIEALRESVRAAAADVDEASAVLAAHRMANMEAVAARERHLRWRADLDARAAAEKRVDAASALFDNVRSAESRIAVTGARALFQAIDRYVPPSMGRAFVDAGNDTNAPSIGIRSPTTIGAPLVHWSGAGLSGAQRLILNLACDRAVDDLYDRPFRLAMVEADALDQSSLAHLCDELRADVAAGTLHQAIVITCHALPPDPYGAWRVVQRGPQWAPPAQESKIRETWATAVAAGIKPMPDTTVRNDATSGEFRHGGAMGPRPGEVAVVLDPEVVLSSVLTTGRVPDEAHHAQLDIDDFAGIGAASPAPAVQRTPLRLVETPAAMPAWLARPGTTGGASPSAVDAQALVDELTAHDAAALRDWPAHARDQSGPTPSWVPLHLSIPTPAFDRCIGKDRRSLTPIGVAAWRILRGVDAPSEVSRTVPPVEPSSSQPSPTAPDGSPLGATADEIRAVVKDLSADALRSMYVQHGGGNPGEKATVGVMRKAIAAVGATRGHHVTAWQVWATDSAAAHPRKVRAVKGSQDAGDDDVEAGLEAGLEVGLEVGMEAADPGRSIRVDTAAPSGTMDFDALRVDGDDGELQ